MASHKSKSKTGTHSLKLVSPRQPHDGDGRGRLDVGSGDGLTGGDGIGAKDDAEGTFEVDLVVREETGDQASLCFGVDVEVAGSGRVDENGWMRK